MKLPLALALALLLASCTGHSPHSAAALAPLAVHPQYLPLVDSVRQRAVPVVLYMPAAGAARAHLRAAIINHGYGGHHTDYAFIAQNLVAHGYFVASIQHELPTDAPLPTTGNPRQVRRPNWEQGVQNILFVRQVLHQRYPRVNFNQLLLVGHSNGGDMAMLFAEEHPTLVRRVISLDNRRMPLPRARWPRVLSLRSSDQVADSGVLPTLAERRRYRTTIITLPHTIHNDMWDGATPVQKQEINDYITPFLAR
jgi:predicted dienelactone hydrolase